MQFSSRMQQHVVTAAGAALALVLMIAGTPSITQAQVRDTTRAASTAQPTPEMMQAQMAMMAPMMGQMAQAMMQAMVAVLARPETTEHLATFTKNYYDALLAKGFTKDDALRIVMAHGIPMMPAAR
ncbi:MAG TPA: hypothetical protein VJU87_12400 [Gemmatimonadaceae bacterium]|nr:hypothetical protein [Gemmatimonadaceae bacterium]